MLLDTLNVVRSNNHMLEVLDLLKVVDLVKLLILDSPLCEVAVDNLPAARGEELVGEDRYRGLDQVAHLNIVVIAQEDLVGLAQG